MKEPKFCSNCGAKIGACDCNKLKTLRYTKAPEHSRDFKVEVFDELHEMCMFHVRGHYGEARCACECDCFHHIAEAALKLCLGTGIFHQLNNYKEYVLDEPATKG